MSQLDINLNAAVQKKAVSLDTVTQSLFENSLLESRNFEPVLHKTPYDFLIAGILFLAFALYVWLFTVNRKRMSQVIKAFYISRFSNQLSRDEVSIGNRVSVILSLLFIITISLFALQLNKYFGYFMLPDRPWIVGLTALSIATLYLIKILVIKLLGYIFKRGKEAADYIFSLIIFGNALGLIMMPLVVAIAFAEQIPTKILIYTGLAVIGIFLCARVVRGILIGVNSNRVSKFYLLLYLCTLEILPFVVLIKLFMLSLKENGAL